MKHPAWQRAVALMLKRPRDRRTRILEAAWASYAATSKAGAAGETPDRISCGDFVCGILDRVRELEVKRAADPAS